MIIDFSAHHIPDAIIARVQKTKFGESRQFLYSSQNADPEIRLALMDKYGVDVHALSLSVPALLPFGENEISEICRISNTLNYALCKAYPSRFVNICVFSLLDMKGTLRELDYAINELDCRGVTIATNQRGKGLDCPEYYPFYNKVVKHDLPILLHPTSWEGY